MELSRILLLIALMFVLLMLWQAWEEDYGRGAVQVGATSETVDAAMLPRRAEDVPDAPALQLLDGMPGEASVPRGPGAAFASAGRVRVTTDLFAIEIDRIGADLRQVDLLQYPVAVNQPDSPVRLFTDQAPHPFIAQTGWVAAGGMAPRRAPDHHQRFYAEADEFRMADGQDELRVPLVWVGEDGTRITKTYTFRRGSYQVEVSRRVENLSGEPWLAHPYQQLQRTEGPGRESWFIYTYTGGVISTDEKRYDKISFSDIASRNLSVSTQHGWLAMIQHYFLGAWVPPQGESHHFYSAHPEGSRYVLGATGPLLRVEPGESAEISATLFVGPKLQSQLREAADHLRLTVDYGWLTIIAQPLYWLLELLNRLVGNWGVAIILLTILIKAIFWPLSAASYRSMGKMRKFQPKLMELKERFGDDRQKLNQAMMDLYRREKINPLGGCLPILVQIPVFIALYWVLLESVELRQAPFMLWIDDLTSRDPYFVLPVLMGLSMFVQMKLNPAPLDPIQQRIFMVLPWVFTVFFAFFPSGLVLYWLVNNIISVAQQSYITRKIERGEVA